VKDVLPDIDRWRARGERFALATVVATRRSAPRPIGAKLAVSEHGEMAGSVSGGCVEADVVVHAQEVLASGRPRLVSYGIEDERAWEVGLPCGGEIDVFVEPLDVEPPRPEEPGVLLTVVQGERAGERSFVAGGDGPTRESGLLELDGELVFAEVLGPPPKLVVFGAGELAEAVCAAGRLLGWQTIVSDPRPALVSPERIPSADELVVEQPEQALERVRPDPDTAVVVLTHEPRLDVPALKAALASKAFYVGALGSRRTQSRRRGLLLEQGVAEEEIDRISGPVGLDIGAKTPPEIAIAIVAEIVSRRASGGAD
jgi:xanthine dehydrogenase accessory factor